MISLPSARSPSPGCTCASARATGNSAPGMSNGARSRTSSKPAPVTAGTTAICSEAKTKGGSDMETVKLALRRDPSYPVGIRARWENGAWRKYLARQGWVCA